MNGWLGGSIVHGWIHGYMVSWMHGRMDEPDCLPDISASFNCEANDGALVFGPVSGACLNALQSQEVHGKGRSLELKGQLVGSLFLPNICFSFSLLDFLFFALLGVRGCSTDSSVLCGHKNLLAIRQHRWLTTTKTATMFNNV